MFFVVYGLDLGFPRGKHQGVM
ncbi:hypothetical protein VARIO8X_60475 [Burkholderiales bacterium 8X]|nr:hypothetical protein VARIO8X_60475 [Burkholderiales bacterium 8X]